MKMTYLVSSKSKDPSTKIGAVVVKPDSNQVLSSGYNGLCRGIHDPCNAEDLNYGNRLVAPEKYFWFEHAERNSIYSAAKEGIRLDGAVMYTQDIPCHDCGRAVIQSGIKKIIIHRQWAEIWANLLGNSWPESQQRTKEMFVEVGVKVDVYDHELGLKTLIKGKEYKI